MKIKKKVFPPKRLGSKGQYLSEFQKVTYSIAGPDEEGEDPERAFSFTAEGTIQEFEVEARARLKALGLPGEFLDLTEQLKDPYAPGHWEALTLFHAHFLREHLAADNTEYAVQEALRMVHVAWRGRWLEWEEDMLRGRSSLLGGQTGGSHGPFENEWATWLRLAKDIRRKDPESGLLAVAEAVCNQLAPSRSEDDEPDVRTVYNYLKSRL